MNRRKRSWTSYTPFLFGAILIGVAFFFGFSYFTKTGIFKVPGVVYYDESLNDDELGILNGVFSEDVKLDKDVYISAENYLEMPSLSDGEFLENVYVLVTDFYNTETNIEISDPDSVLSAANDDEDVLLIDVGDLSFDKKLLSINDNYYLDTFNSGAVFRVIKFVSDKYNEEIEPLVGEIFTQSFPEKSSVLSFAQTGVTALSRGMNKKLDEVDDPVYFASKIKDYLSGFDLTHTSNESSFSDFASGSNICSDERFFNTLTSIGLDIVELTGNHNQDCGDEDAAKTIDLYHENNIQTVGGGKNIEEAAIPLEIKEKGNNITFLAYNLSTGGITNDDTPGANQYNEENFKTELDVAKTRGDFVIVDIQYFECSEYVSESEDVTCDYPQNTAGDEVEFFRHLIELGADMVVGTSAHQPQSFELYENGVIYYGLGNLFFDQVWWPGTTRSLILSHYFYNGKLLQTKIVPTVYDINMQTDLMDTESSRWFLSRLINAKP